MKLKTRKSAVKRIKKKKTCLARKNAFKGHLLRKKSQARKRKLSQNLCVSFVNSKAIKLMLPY
jgi:large subunit ribosomal protein L35